MRIFVEALVIFFATLFIAGLVALGRPAQASAQGLLPAAAVVFAAGPSCSDPMRAGRV